MSTHARVDFSKSHQERTRERRRAEVIDRIPTDGGTAGHDAVYDTLEAASAEELRKLVKRLIAQQKVSKPDVARMLSGPSRERSARGSVASAATLERDQVCKGCGKRFAEAENMDGVCSFYRYHPAEPELNYDDPDDFWCDTDFDLHEVPFEDAPEGYIFSCCNEKGTHPGCTKSRHVASRKRARVD